MVTRNSFEPQYLFGPEYLTLDLKSMTGLSPRTLQQQAPHGQFGAY